MGWAVRHGSPCAVPDHSTSVLSAAEAALDAVLSRAPCRGLGGGHGSPAGLCCRHWSAGSRGWRNATRGAGIDDYLAALWQVINNYPLARRPVRIAANLLDGRPAGCGRGSAAGRDEAGSGCALPPNRWRNSWSRPAWMDDRSIQRRSSSWRRRVLEASSLLCLIEQAGCRAAQQHLRRRPDRCRSGAAILISMPAMSESALQ